MEKKRLAVFASGRGSNFQVILDNTVSGYIPANIILLITNKPDAGALGIAGQNSIRAEVFEPKKFADADAFNAAILNILIEERIDYIVLAGYLKMIGPEITRVFSNKIVNIHPALLPSFGGKGMYGHHVHYAVFAHGVKISGVTVHLVNDEYDDGPIVMQKCVDISHLNSPEEIAAAVLKIEHQLYPKVVKALTEERIRLHGRRVEITGVQI
jgi:formyltetrahydrofolate-dependent phosphoribosylglycinamide formyltransferase